MISKQRSGEPDWIFFGGTFDPPHIGHMEAVRIVRDRFAESEIVVVPSFEPPVSRDVSKQVEASFSDRVAMCVVAFDEWPRVQVSALEEDLESPSYTIKTLRDLRSEYPMSHLAWMIGSDQLAAFASWSEPEKILEIASLIVVPRPAHHQEDLVDTAARVSTSLGFKVSIDRDKKVVLLDGGGSIFILDSAPPDVASRDLRATLRSSTVKSVQVLESQQSLIAPAVLDYINESGLYVEKVGE